MHTLLRTLRCLVRFLAACLGGKKPVRLTFFVHNYPGQRVTLIGENMLILTAVQKVALSVQPVDAAGNPAPVESITWSVSDPAILSVEPAEDGMSAVCFAQGPVGTAQVVVVADADLGEGMVEIQGVLDVQVISGMAVGLSISAGVPENK